MIKATGKGPEGRDTLFIGLSFGNLDKFHAAPLDSHIRIDGKELGLSHDVLIFSGATEAAMADLLAQGAITLARFAPEGERVREINAEWSEPAITINGTRLTTAQAMTIRVALGSFARDLQSHHLGGDDHGEAMTQGYLAAIYAIHQIMEIIP